MLPPIKIKGTRKLHWKETIADPRKIGALASLLGGLGPPDASCGANSKVQVPTDPYTKTEQREENPFDIYIIYIIIYIYTYWLVNKDA